MLDRSTDSGRRASLQKQETKRISGGLPVTSPMFLSEEEKINCLENEFFVVSMRCFHRWGDLVFIMDDHDNFPSWIMIRIFLSLGERFYFLIVNLINKG